MNISLYKVCHFYHSFAIEIDETLFIVIYVYIKQFSE